MNQGYQIRLAEEGDADGILDIYRPFVLNNAVTFENEVPTSAEIAQRVKVVLQKHLWLVCLWKGKVIAYVYTATFRQRIAYQWVAESSIYLHEDFRGRGIGRILYHALIALSTMQGYKRLYGVMTAPNAGSKALHESLGFESFATFKDAGFKLGSWHSTEWFELVLDESRSEPEEIRAIQGILKTEVGQEILEMAEETLNLYDR
ncbi:N-acetyltransferase [bacterium SCSIO 12741]|nr:N-acetyltransferase [bacterium SCSIO 12741]